MFGKRVVVLGGAGFVGRAVVNELSKQGYEVRVGVRRPERFRDYALFPNTKLFAIKDYQDEALLKGTFENCDIVVNLLADLTAGIEALPSKDLVLANQKVKKAIELSQAKRVVSLSQIGAGCYSSRKYAFCSSWASQMRLCWRLPIPKTPFYVPAYC